MTARAQVLHIPKPPPDRGRWLTVADVCAMLGNQVSQRWVYANVPNKVKLSRKTAGWWEDDVRAWLEARRAS